MGVYLQLYGELRSSGIVQAVLSGTFQIGRLDLFKHGGRRTTDRAPPSSQASLLMVAGFLFKGIAD